MPPSPHPKAARVFTNWMGTKEAQGIYEKKRTETSLRTDVDTGNAVPDHVQEKPDVKYAIDDYVYGWYIGERVAHLKAFTNERPR